MEDLYRIARTRVHGVWVPAFAGTTKESYFADRVLIA
jgi:hypothetical protein